MPGTLPAHRDQHRNSDLRDLPWGDSSTERPSNQVGLGERGDLLGLCYRLAFEAAIAWLKKDVSGHGSKRRRQGNDQNVVRELIAVVGADHDRGSNLVRWPPWQRDGVDLALSRSSHRRPRRVFVFPRWRAARGSSSQVAAAPAAASSPHEASSSLSPGLNDR